MSTKHFLKNVNAASGHVHTVTATKYLAGYLCICPVSSCCHFMLYFSLRYFHAWVPDLLWFLFLAEQAMQTIIMKTQESVLKKHLLTSSASYFFKCRCFRMTFNSIFYCLCKTPSWSIILPEDLISEWWIAGTVEWNGHG